MKVNLPYCWAIMLFCTPALFCAPILFCAPVLFCAPDVPWPSAVVRAPDEVGGRHEVAAAPPGVHSQHGGVGAGQQYVF